MNIENKSNDETVKVKRGSLRSVDVYDVSNEELSQLEQGTGGSIFLNLAVSLLSSALSFLIAILTTDIESTSPQFIIFWIFVAAFLVGSGICFVLWWKDRGSVKNVIQEIRSRMNGT